MERNVVRGRWVASSALFGLAMALSPAPALAAPPPIRDLGTLGGGSAFARDINEPGQIVGESTTASGTTHAFLSTPWVRQGRLVDLGTLGGAFSQALAVSNRGQVTGSSTLDASGEQSRAFVWEQGRMTALPPLAGAAFSSGIGINDAGVVVGISGGVAARWRNGTVQSLGTLAPGESSFANGINASGVIVGTGGTGTGEFHAWVFRNGVMTDLGAFGGTNSSADGINSSGDIVGRFEPFPGAAPHGYVLKNGVFRDLGVIDQFSGATAISDSGLIVGEGGVGNDVHAVLWDFGGAIVDLGALAGSTFSSATSVNSGGTVVGVSFLGGNIRAVAWR